MKKNIYKIEDLFYPITKFCPGRCLNCNIYKQDPKIEDEISVELFEKVLQSKVLKDVFYFSLTGGEVHLSSKFIPVPEIIAKYKPFSYIHSNTSGWYPDRTIEIAKKGLQLFGDKFRIDISVDGPKEAYEKVRLKENGRERAMFTAKELLKLGLKPTFVMIVYKENFAYIKDFIKLCEEMKVNWYIGFYIESEIFNNTDNNKKFTLEEINFIESTLQDIGFFKTKHYVNWLWAKSVYLGKVPKFKCFMGKRSIMMDPYGNVFPCGGGQESKLKDMCFLWEI